MSLPGLSQQEFTDLLLSVGKSLQGRRPLSPVEVGKHCTKSIAAGATPKQITEALMMTDRTMVKKFQRLSDLVPEARHLVGWGHSGDRSISFSTATLLASMSETDQDITGQAVLRHRLTRDETRSIIQLLERSGDTLEACIDRVIRRRPIVRLRYMILGAVIDESAKASLSTLSQNQRDDLLNQVLSRNFPNTDKFTTKLGIDRFTIIGGKKCR